MQYVIATAKIVETEHKSMKEESLIHRKVCYLFGNKYNSICYNNIAV